MREGNERRGIQALNRHEGEPLNAGAITPAVRKRDVRAALEHGDVAALAQPPGPRRGAGTPGDATNNDHALAVHDNAGYCGFPLTIFSACS